MHPPWNDELDTLLRKLLVDDGLTLREAISAMGRPAGDVSLRAKLVGLADVAKRAWTVAEELRLRTLHGEGASLADLSSALRFPTARIRLKIDELELKRFAAPTPARVAPSMPKPTPVRLPAVRVERIRSPVPRAPPAEAPRPFRQDPRIALEAARARAKAGAAQARVDADAILAAAKRAEREAKAAAAAGARRAKAEAELSARTAAAEAKRLERDAARLAREAEAAELRRRRDLERAEAKRLADAAKAEKAEREERETRKSRAVAVAEGRGGNIAGGVVRRAFAPPGPKRKALTREDALTVRTSSADAIARFLAERGVTRVQLDPTEAAVTGLRRKGYTVLRDGEAFIVDGRHKLASCEALREFASRRAVQIPPFLQAAE